MPIIIMLKDTTDKFRDIFLLVKESNLSFEAIQMIKSRCNLLMQETDTTLEDIIIIAEETVHEYGGTLVPFTMFRISY